MPSVLTIGPYTFLFFSSDGPEPPHIHVRRDRAVAKFWLEPIALAKNRGLRQHELREVERLIQEHRTFLIRAWHDYFDTDD